MISAANRSLAVLVLVAAAALAACGGAAATPDVSASPAPPESPRTLRGAEAVATLAGRAVIDVRTPEEFAAGHLAGAVNIDIQASDFAARIAALDKDAPYFVYCRSGNRSAAAVQRMTEAGFTDLVDGGGLNDLLAAGAPGG